MATKTGLHMNWSSVVVAPPSPASAVTVTGVTNFTIDNKANVETFYGDARSWPRVARATTRTCTVTIESGDIEAAYSIPEAVPCSIVAKLDDAINEASTGSIVFTIGPAMRTTRRAGGQDNKFATGTITFEVFSDDGSDPVQYTVTG